MKLSIIIPTRNRSFLLNRTLNSIVGQTLSQAEFEVLVIDNDSKDDTKKVVDSFINKIANIKYFYEDTPGLHVGRHRGLKEAKSDILVYADDDIEAFPTWLEAINESFKDDSVVLVGGKILPKWEGEVPDWIDRLWEKQNKFGKCLGYLSILDFGDNIIEIPAGFVFGCNFSIRKKILIKARGFHPDGMPKELIKFRGDGESYVSKYIQDNYLKTIYNPKASIYHIVTKERLTIDYFCNRAYNQGISDSYKSLRIKYLLRGKVNNKLIILIRLVKFLLELISLSKKRLELKKIKINYQRGYKYHQREFKKDLKLREWVLKENYFKTINLNNKKNILIIQYDYPLSTITRDFAISLSKNGYKVQLILCYSKVGWLIKKKNMKGQNIDYVIINSFSILKRVLNKIYTKIILKNNRLLKIIFHFINIEKILINDKIVKKIFSKVCEKKEDIISIIGIEKKGLIYAGKIADIINRPLIYYSLELYTDEHPVNQSNIIAKKILELEKVYHKKSLATIVQDNDRADFLFKNNNVYNRRILIPVYNRGEPITAMSSYFYNKFNIESSKKIVVYIGTITPLRCIDEIVMNTLREEYTLVLHGFGQRRYLNKLRREKNIIISTDLVEENKIFELISSAHIGLAIYRQDIVNDYLTVFSSTKIAQYLRCGIPIIGWDNDNYRKLIYEFKCGELVGSYRCLNTAISKILGSYEDYRKEAFRAYDKYYNLDNTIKNLTTYLDEL